MIVDVLTTTRADYGALRPLVYKMNLTDDIRPRVLITGTHLSDEFGMTYKEVEKDGFEIGCKIPILSENSGAIGVSETMANAMSQFANYFHEHRPDFLLIDGDRYETLAICIAAVNDNIPVIHLGGGATTEGAADEYYRHAITKLSYIHFATIEAYKNRIIQMGEDPSRVFLVGSPLIENILNTDFLSKDELEDSIGFKLDMPFAVVTFHPVTLDNKTAVQQIRELLAACSEYDNMKYIITLSNADKGGNLINNEIKEFVDSFNRAIWVTSLGSLRYYSALKYASCVIGNSSSGIIEAPSFHIPTINIGDRQKGRIQSSSVINCMPEKEIILNAIRKASSTEFKQVCKDAVNPNGDGNTSGKVVNILREVWKNGIDIKKSFHNISL